MPVDEVRRRDRQVRGARHEVDVHPRVDAQAGVVGLGEDGRQRIEAGRLSLEIGGAGLEAAGEVRIAAAADLHEERVEPVVARGADERRDGFRRTE